MVFNDSSIDLKLAKSEIRKKVLTERLALDKGEVAAKSRLINAALDTLEPLSKARVIMGYAPFRNEVDVMPWLLKKLALGIKVLLPRVNTETGDLEAVPLLASDQMSISKMGVSEPQGAGIDLQEIEAVIIPGVVFDRRGYRLGYGKGFYDRFLPRLRLETFCCAVAFELQVVNEIPYEAHDFRVRYLVTESGVRQASIS